jgi:hypothetical protein
MSFDWDMERRPSRRATKSLLLVQMHVCKHRGFAKPRENCRTKFKQFNLAFILQATSSDLAPIELIWSVLAPPAIESSSQQKEKLDSLTRKRLH